MVMRMWLAGGGVMMAGLMAGMGLGSYATHIPVASPASIAAENGDMGASAIDLRDRGPSADALRGPSEISCEGCGPTLSDRRMAADMAELPVPAYLADEDYHRPFDDMPPPDYEVARTVAAPAPSLTTSSAPPSAPTLVPTLAPTMTGSASMIGPARSAPAL